MRVVELWRYPVKSLGGERLDVAQLGPRGVHADRLWAVRDVERRETTTGRRIGALLRCSARYGVPGGEATGPGTDAGPGCAPPVVITFPDGSEAGSGDPEVHARLSALVGRSVELVPLPAVGDTGLHRARLQTPATLRRDLGIPDGERLPNATVVPLRKLAGLVRWTTPPGTFFDLYPLHVLTVEALAAMAARAPGTDFDVRRFRPNVVVEGAGTDDEAVPEFAWAGGLLATAAGATIRVAVPTIRCVVPTREQPGLAKDPQVMRTVAAQTGRFLGVYADVERGGSIAVGDELELRMPAPPSRARRAARAAGVRAVGAVQRLVPGG